MLNEVHRPDPQQLAHVPTARYRYVRHLKRTKMSEVWLAERADGTRVAVKVALVDGEGAQANLAAIRNEVQWRTELQKKLGQASAGIVQLVPALETTQGKPSYYAETKLDGKKTLFLVTEYLAGGTLQTLVDRAMKQTTTGANGVTVAQALEITEYIAHIVAQMHTEQCVHLDLKPQNIMFHRLPPEQQPIGRNNLVIIDIGLAQKVGDVMSKSISYNWAAPERIKAKDAGRVLTVHPDMDIYSIGMILRYLLTGQHPRFISKALLAKPLTESELHFSAKTSTSQRAQLTAGINTLLSQCLAATPSARPSAVEVEKAAKKTMETELWDGSR